MVFRRRIPLLALLRAARQPVRHSATEVVVVEGEARLAGLGLVEVAAEPSSRSSIRTRADG